MKLAIVGSRTFTNYEILEETLSTLEEPITEIISGGAPGADALAERWATKHNIPITVHKADWAKYGRAAGPKRNKKIIEDCDACVAFWDGKSKGTKNSIELSKKAGKKTKVVIGVKWYYFK